MSARYIVGDVFDVLATLEPDSVDLVFSSPPFLALRSYLPADHPDKGKEIGSEATPADFLDTLLDVVEALDRVLAPHGSLCFELGDTFSGSGGAGGDYNADGLREGQEKFTGSGKRSGWAGYDKKDGNSFHGYRKPGEFGSGSPGGGRGWPEAKSLCLIPTLFAASLAYGYNMLRPERKTPRWRVRNLVVWARPNPPVGALGDKFRPATSYVTVATKSARRYFDLDAVRTPSDLPEMSGGAFHDHGDDGRQGRGQGMKPAGGGVTAPGGAPPLDYWVIPTHPYPGSHYACVDADTEGLTPDGWKRYTQIKPGDLIAAYEPDAGTWRWQPVREMRSYLYDGPMVAFEKRTMSQRLTPNHRVLYRTRKQPTPQIRRADEITERAYLPMSAMMALDTPTEGPGEKLAALAGWMVTEGGWSGNLAMLYQSETANPQHCVTIRGLLDGVGADWYEHDGHNGGVTFTIRGELAHWLMGFHKRLPMSAVFGWPLEDALALFEAMIDGDGHRRPNGRWSFIQKSEAISDAFQALATRLGYRTMQSQLRGDGIRVVYCSADRWVDLRAGDGGTDSAISTEHYVGVVWCPRVDSGIWFARRNGRPFITGNTFPPELVVKPVASMCPIRVCRVCGEPSRRITSDKAAFDCQPDLAAHIKERREALGITSAEINEWFGYKEIAKNWERTDKHGAAIPNANDWPVLKERLGLSDEWDAVVLGDRRWTESTIEYERDGRTLTDAEKRSDYGRGGLGLPDGTYKATRVAPDEWTDCGCGTCPKCGGTGRDNGDIGRDGMFRCSHCHGGTRDRWRSGVVLDPFAGSGTTLAVATGHGRDAIGIDLDSRNAELALERVGPMFLTVEHLNAEPAA